MISMEKLLDMIATEAIEHGGMSEEHLQQEGYPITKHTSNKEHLPPIRYDLELIKAPDGHIYWVE